MSESFANPQVLEFYRQLPFNYHESAARQANMVRGKDSVQAYPALLPLLRPGLDAIEVGCGAGWFSLSLALHHRCRVRAIDFNPVVVERAREMARLLKQDVAFEVADLFTWQPASPAALVCSIGVLHHTDNCIAAVERCCREFCAPGGHVFIGLYHLHGRRPFLDHFARLQAEGVPEEALFAEYRRLHPQLTDETFARSWFRDQVLHPHETQHTLREMLPVLERQGMDLVATSINGFRPITDLPAILAREERMAEDGEAALAKGEYYPGFFVFLARKRPA